MKDSIVIDDVCLEVRRSNRRKSFGLTVGRQGELIAHAPSHVHEQDLVAWITRKRMWIYRKLALKQQTQAIAANPEFVQGSSFYYLGRRYRLRFVDEQDVPLLFDGMFFTVKRGALPYEQHFRAWFISMGRAWLIQRVRLLSKKTGTEPSRLVVRDLGYRWGSCGRNGNLYFNWRLFQLPVRLIDYVVVHELTHLKDRTHGAAFWRGVSWAMPDWKKRAEALDKAGTTYLLVDLPTS